MIGSFHDRAPGLRYNENAIAPGAQTGRPGDAGPVRASLGGKNRTGRFSLLAWIRRQRATVGRDRPT